MDNSEKINFLNNECKIFNISISNLSFYFLVLNINEQSSYELINFFQNYKKELNILPREKDENSFIISNLNKVIPSASIKNKEIINKLIKEDILNRYACMINIKGQNIITFDIEGLIEEIPELITLGVILSQKEANLFYELLRQNKNILLQDFKEVEIDRISCLFFDDLKMDVNEEQEDSLYEKDIYNKEFDNNGEQSLNDDDIEVSSNKKQKHTKKTPRDEDYGDDQINSEGKKRRKRRKDEDDSIYQDDVTVFLSKLREAIEIDKLNFNNKKPAFEKLKLLPKIQNFLANASHQRLFIQFGGLELLQEWIKKNRDGTYPALNQITQILEILSSMSLTLGGLKSCQIGGYVMELSKNMKESKNIQNKARELVEKWSRIVWDINTNYCHIDQENQMYEMIYRKKRYRDDLIDNEYKSKENNDISEITEVNKNKRDNDLFSHAKIPKKGYFEFTRKPESNLNDSKNDDLIKIKHNFFDNKKKVGKKKFE